MATKRKAGGASRSPKKSSKKAKGTKAGKAKKAKKAGKKAAKKAAKKAVKAGARKGAKKAGRKAGGTKAAKKAAKKTASKTANKSANKAATKTTKTANKAAKKTAKRPANVNFRPQATATENGVEPQAAKVIKPSQASLAAAENAASKPPKRAVKKGASGTKAAPGVDSESMGQMDGGAEEGGDEAASEGDADPDPEGPIREAPRSRGLSVDDYIAQFSGWKAEVALRLRAILKTAAPDASESIKWGQPTYELGGQFAYFAVFKDTVNLGFWRGGELAGQGLLRGGGKQMRHVRISEATPLDADFFDRLSRLVAEAARLGRSQ